MLVKKLLQNEVYTEIQAPVAGGKFLIGQTSAVVFKSDFCNIMRWLCVTNTNSKKVWKPQSFGGGTCTFRPESWICLEGLRVRSQPECGYCRRLPYEHVDRTSI